MTAAGAQLGRRQTRLPWLDGNQGRQPSVPRLPGSFVDDDGLLPEPLRASTSVRLGADATMSPVPMSAALGNTSFASVADAPSLRPAVPTRSLSRQLSLTAAQQIAARAMQAPIYDPVQSKPAIPLVTLARQLHVSDSFTSDVEPSIKTRARSLSDSSGSAASTLRTPPPVVSPQPRRSVAAPVLSTTSSTLTMTRAGAEYRRSPSPKTTDLPVSPVEAKDRRVSFSVQPINTDRIRRTNGDSEKYKERALSVQPIAARTWKELPPLKLEGDHEDTTAPSASNHAATTDSLRNAVEGLENLMQEALHLAKHAADHDHPEEVPGILNEASRAMKGVSAVQDKHEIVMQGGRPNSSEMESSSTWSYDIDAVPPMSYLDFVHRRQSTAVPGRSATPGTTSAKSTRNVPVPASTTQPNVRTVWDEEWPHHRLGSETMGQENTSDHGMTAHDWAYHREVQPTGRMPATSPRSDHLPEPPAATRAANREHVNLVSRGIASPSDLPLSAVGDPVVPPRKSSLAARKPTLANRGISGADGTPSPESPGQGPTTEPPLHAREADIPDSAGHNWGSDKFNQNDFTTYEDALKGRNHIVLKDGDSFHWGYKPQPIARNWGLLRKRWTACIVCLNTALIGILIGVYAGEVPAIQYALADRHHRVILGNVVLYLAIGLVVLIFWPLPLLHGRRPYTLTGLAVALPLQIPQAVIVGTQRGTNYTDYVAGLLVSRALTGIALGFVHINLISTLLDLFGASLQSDNPHGELVMTDDVRRHGGGMGLWLGFWSWCWIGSLAIGFLIGAEVISGLNIAWGFYLCVILIALMLLLTVITPETRRSQHRRTMQEVELPNDTVSRRVARGEIKMHVYGDGPKWWWEEVFAGMYLSMRMLSQSGFMVMALYLAWIYAEVVLIIVLLGNLLSVNYRFRPEYVGLGVFGIAVGALLAVPCSKANLFSGSRTRGPRTDSMTIQPRFAWTSHFFRRALFMTALPIAGVAYTLSSKGKSVQFMAPIIFAALIGYITNLAIAESNGIIMETFDTCDLQPGANSRHRLQSLAPTIVAKRTTYSSYPRVSAGLFVTQGLAYLLAAAATGIGGAVTRSVGAQKATAITAGILLGLTALLTCALIRYKTVQVIPNELFGQHFGSTADSQRRASAASGGSAVSEGSWRAVIIGNPSGKSRRMNWLELGSLSRWTEIRRLNRLLNRSTTQGLNPGWQ
jgi:uncharacterized membrane protein